MKNTQFFTLGLRDIAKGFLVAMLTAIITGLGTVLQNGTIPTETELKNLVLIGLSAGIAYLGKNLLTNSNDQFLKKEPKNNNPTL